MSIVRGRGTGQLANTIVHSRAQPWPAGLYIVAQREDGSQVVEELKPADIYGTDARQVVFNIVQNVLRRATV